LLREFKSSKKKEKKKRKGKGATTVKPRRQQGWGAHEAFRLSTTGGKKNPISHQRLTWKRLRVKVQKKLTGGRGNGEDVGWKLHTLKKPEKGLLGSNGISWERNQLKTDRKRRTLVPLSLLTKGERGKRGKWQGYVRNRDKTRKETHLY